MASDHSEEDYIDMEVSSYEDMDFLSSTSIVRSSYSFTNPREFEFQMCSAARETDRPTTSPADELFYKGKLLPLHLPPRLQMVEKLLDSANAFPSSFARLDYNEDASFDHEFFSTPLTTTAPTPTATSTPFESCNISPSESFRISGEINAELPESLDKNSFSKLKKPRNVSFGAKLKASRAYLRSFFGRSGCSSESSTAARKVADEGAAAMHVKVNKKNSLFAQIPRIRAESELPNGRKEKSFEQAVTGRHRRSFSLALRRHSTAAENKSSSLSSSSSSSSSSSGSSSFSSNSNNRIRDQFTYLKRCGSANYSEIESSIQGAIAHCNQSQKMIHSRNSVSASIT